MARRLMAMVTVGLLAATPAFAQDARPLSNADLAAFQQSIRDVKFDAAQDAGLLGAGGSAVPRPKERSKVQRVLWTSLAGVGGFFAGGYIGAAIEGDSCNCDDPGFKGFLIGLPIGTAAAAITTWILTGK